MGLKFPEEHGDPVFEASGVLAFASAMCSSSYITRLAHVDASETRDYTMAAGLILLIFAAASCVQGIEYATDKINVHIVPHTHDDTGWQVTVDQYYYESVQYILDTVVEELQIDRKRRFIYVEIAFFERWWRQQTESTQAIVRSLVNEGALEFINGGWCMNDEAATHYNAIVDQMTEGFLVLKRAFGDSGRPRVAWHIDPFGHSSAQASLFAQMGFDGFFFARIDYQDLAKRSANRTLEMIWRGSPSLGAGADMFTGAFFRGTYGPPQGFRFDNDNDDFHDDMRLEDYNVVEKLALFANDSWTQNASIVGNHILVTMGSDFAYKNAHRWFKNVDKLIQYANSNESLRLNAFYSTPSIYVEAKHALDDEWTLKTDDFLPHSSGPHSYWSGFFTSRPSLKGYSRWANNWLQICKQLETIVGPYNDVITSTTLRRALAVLQHHDAITGTEKQAVTYDYELRVSEGSDACALVVGNALARLVDETNALKIDFCFLANVSVCPSTENATSFVVFVYNPLPRATTWPVRFPVSKESDYVVRNFALESVPSTVFPVGKETSRVRGNRSSALYEVVFQATAPPLGYATYFVETAPATTPIVESAKPKEDFSISNSMLRLTFDGATGRLKLVENLKENMSTPVTQELRWYNASAGNNKLSKQASGAYVFRPNSSETYDLADGMPYEWEVFKSDVVEEVRQIVHDGVASQVVRLYAEASYAEFEFTVGPIPIKDGWGKEIISRFTSNLASEKTFYTDANGREMQRRVRFHRDTYEINLTEPVASNYFPVDSRIAIQDRAAGVQLTVLTDRSQGGSSMNDGEVELMIHRRLLYDDHFGVGEPLNEPGRDGRGLIIRGSHFLQVAPIERAGRMHRLLGERIFMQPRAGVAAMEGTAEKWVQNRRGTYSGLKEPLPENVHLLTLQREPEGVLVRLDHQFAVGEDEELSRPVEVPGFDGMFTSLEVESVEEMTLGANLLKKEENRLVWKVVGEKNDDDDVEDGRKKNVVSFPDETISLNPMDIRTFFLQVKE